MSLIITGDFASVTVNGTPGELRQGGIKLICWSFSLVKVPVGPDDGVEGAVTPVILGEVNDSETVR